MITTTYRMGLPLHNQNIIRDPLYYKDIDSLKANAMELLGCPYFMSSLKDVILAFAALTCYLSREELFFIYRIRSSALDRALKTLTKEKNRYLNTTIQRESHGGATRKYYHLTTKGHKYATGLFAGNLTIKQPKTPKKLFHSYGAGMNILQMLLAGIPCLWDKEKELSRYSGFMRNGDSLWTDMACLAWPKDPNRHYIYFEEDTGTERSNVLLEKIASYSRKGYMNNPNDLIIFSSMTRSAPNLSLLEKQLIFGPKRKDLLKSLEDSGSPSLQDMIRTNFSDKEILRLAQEFIDYVEKDNQHIPVTVEYLQEFISEDKFLRNPWHLAVSNTPHKKLATKTLDNLTRLIMNQTQEMFPAFLKMLRGYQIYSVATPLVADVVRWAFLDHFSSCKEQIIRSGKNYFRDMKYSGPLSDYIPTPNGVIPEINLRNAFTYANGCTLAVEYLCFDISAWIRIGYLISTYNHSDLPVRILCVFDDRQQAMDFSRRMAYEREGYLFGIYRYNIGQPGRIFMISYDSEEKEGKIMLIPER